MPARTQPRLRAAAGLLLIATAATACTSSPPHTSTGSASVPKAFQAWPLVTGGGLPVALGTPLNGFKDDGSTASADGVISKAEMQSRLTRFHVSLQSYPNPAEADLAYNRLTLSGGRPISGLGDTAMDLVATQVIVRKASQVLVVGVDTTPAGLDYIADHGKTPASLLAVLDQPARAVAGVIAPNLLGVAVSGTSLQTPAAVPS
jgi:hypothetical protein